MTLADRCGPKVGATKYYPTRRISKWVQVNNAHATQVESLSADPGGFSYLSCWFLSSKSAECLRPQSRGTRVPSLAADGERGDRHRAGSAPPPNPQELGPVRRLPGASRDQTRWSALCHGRRCRRRVWSQDHS